MNTGFVNNIIISGFPGSGKTFVIMYIIIYARSKVSTVVSVAMLCHLAIKLGGWHFHKHLCIPVHRGYNMSVYQLTEFSIHKLEHFTNIIGFIQSIHMIYNDKIGQTPSKFDNVNDNIFKCFCGMNVHKGKKSS